MVEASDRLLIDERNARVAIGVIACSGSVAFSFSRSFGHEGLFFRQDVSA
jgi:hypothetical protein